MVSLLIYESLPSTIMHSQLILSTIRIQDSPENDRITVEPRLSDSRREDRILDPEDAAVLDQLEKDIYLGVISYS